MKDSQQQQQQPQQPLKFIQVSNVKKKPFKRKKYYPTKSTNNKQQGKSNPVSSNNNSITCNEHDEQQASHPHVHSTTTCSSSSLSNSNYNNNIQRNGNNSTTLHEMIPSSDINNANLMNMNGNFNGNPMSSSHALDGSSQQHMQQQLTNKHGATLLHVFNNNTMDDASKHSDSSSVGIEHHMHRGSTSSPATILSSSNAFMSGSTMNANNNNNSMLQFVMEASPKYTTHVAKKRNTLSKDNLIKVLHLSQVQACRVLGCSLSTLKRRFGEVKQELGMEKWPSYYDDVRHLPIFPKLYPMSLQFILNEHECSDIPNCNLIFENAAQLSIIFPKPPSSPED